MVLAADQLVRLADPDDLADAGHRAQVEGLELGDVADQPDDGALDTAADEGRPAGALDAGDDSVDLLGRSAGAHDDDHGENSSETRRAPGGCPGLSVWSGVRAQYAAPDRETRTGNT